MIFVLGVAFMATMDFEADMIGIESKFRQGRTGTDGIAQGLGVDLQKGLLAGGGVPFGADALGTSPLTFAEMPGVHNTFSPIEPYLEPFDATTDDAVIWGWLTDLTSRKTGLYDGWHLRNLFGQRPTDPRGVHASWMSGRLTALPGGPARPVDADGDGIVDALAWDVEEYGLLSATQRAEISEVLNPDGARAGRVYLGARVVPHGGMVNINESHPTLIRNALGLPQYVDLGMDPDPDYSYFQHRPTREQVGYPPAYEEPALRRRGLLPGRVLPPLQLSGNPFLNRQFWPFGRADMAAFLYPPRAVQQGNDPYWETVYEGDHRYWPFDPSEPYRANDPDGPSLWAMRMEPETSFRIDAAKEQYDRRHLLTTVGHDDLLSRGLLVDLIDLRDNRVTARRDIHDLMVDANIQAWGRDPDTCTIPFEYANYPHDVPNGYDPYNRTGYSWCECVDMIQRGDNCALNPRKGRLQLSIPWVGEALANGLISPDQAIRLVQDVFTILLLNARDLVDDVDPTSARHSLGRYPLDQNGNPDWDVWIPDYEAISRTAASLTANFFDFADFDDDDDDGNDDAVPTRVELRSCDFNQPGAGLPLQRNNRRQYVYGLERQPYITEFAVETESVQGAPVVRAWAIELFDPYDTDLISSGSDVRYSLIATDPDDPRDGMSAGKFVPLERSMRREEYTVFRAGGGPQNPGIASIPGEGPVQGPRGVQGRVWNLGGQADETFFQNGWIVYLVRNVSYDGGQTTTHVVLDQIQLPGDIIQYSGIDGEPSEVYSVQRVASTARPWTAPVPKSALGGKDEHTIAFDNDATDPDVRPVEVVFSDSGDLKTAYPTTGSLLLLMRHANRSTDDYDDSATPIIEEKELAFTTWLHSDRPLKTRVYDPALGDLVDQPVELHQQIDNGHLPIFDTGVLHHIDPAADMLDAPDPNQDPDLRMPPGRLEHLPWGQLVFDYFTALPLTGGGPYSNPTGDQDFQVKEDALPRVDLSGLRVHGRININAAPWTVLSGLPKFPAGSFDLRSHPSTVDKIKAQAGLDDAKAQPVGDDWARAVVAYRELRAVADSGDYRPHRSWYGTEAPVDGQPFWRRGSGYMGLGELAQVRHPAAGASYRTDFGLLKIPSDPATEDFVSAVSLLVSLGDWATVRSQVFTVYGVLRGEEDLEIQDPDDEREARLRIEDVDSRALRFQETLDRLPTFLGVREPVRIGQRVLGAYTDSLSD
jgi:hypothetical protein